MWLQSITLCCLLLNVQLQTYASNYNSDIQFLDEPRIVSAVPLSVPNPNDLDQNAIRSIFPNDQPQKCSKGIYCGNVQQQNGIRQNTGTLNQNLAQQQQQQQLGTQRPTQFQAPQIFQPQPQTQISDYRQSIPQRSQEAQRIHENAPGRVHNSAIHFSDAPQSAVSLSIPNPNVVRSLVQNDQPQKCSTGTCGNVQQQNGIRQNTATLNQNLAQQQQQQQLGTQRLAQSQYNQMFRPEPHTQTSYGRQRTPQRSQEAQRIHENAPGRVHNSAIHFSDAPQSAVSLSIPNPNVVRSLVQNDQPQKCSTGTCGNVQQQNGIRQNTATLNQNLAQQQQQQQFGTQRPAQSQYNQMFRPEPHTQTLYDRQSTPQRSQEAQRIHENAPGRVQLQPNGATIQQLSQGPPNFSQSGQKLPQRQGGPSTSVSQNPLNKPAGFPTPVKPPPVSNLNYPTEAAPGFNNLLFSVTDFGMNMIKTVKMSHPGNLVLSPFSITLLLGLLQQGAAGQTQAQITNALNMPAETTASAYYKISDDIKARGNSRNILKITNHVFVAQNFNVAPDFKNVAVQRFSSEVTPISFTKPESAAREINSWVSSRTGGKIENLIAPDAIDYTTQIVLVNAVYFKGLWDVPFRVELTHPKKFHLSNGQTKIVDTMRMRNVFKTGKDSNNNAEVIIMPFERDEYQLMVILPSELVGMDRTLESLNADRLLSYQSFNSWDVDLEIPKFTIKTDMDLTAVLQKMGVTGMFRRDNSELDGIGRLGTQAPYISSAVHSAFLSIDEKGGTAAAATSFAAVALSYDDPDIGFKVNRPFIAVLWDKQSSLPLFMAKIEEPLQ